jgi:hypothetical protein
MSTTKSKKPAEHVDAEIPVTPAVEAILPGEEAPMELDKAAGVLSAVRARWSPLGSPQRTAFRALATDEARTEMGKETRSEGVLADAVRWVVKIDSQLREHPSLLEHYSEARFMYLVERTQDLRDRIASAHRQDAERRPVIDAMGARREHAVELRKGLLRRMRRYAGDRADEVKAINDAQGTIATPDLLTGSIKALVDVARGWMKQSDATAKVLIEDAGLTEERVSAALAAAEALSAKAIDAALAGPSLATDPPVVNRAEGGVLLEMARVLEGFEAAHEENPAVERLVPGNATRHVLGPKKAKEKAKAPVEAAPKQA